MRSSIFFATVLLAAAFEASSADAQCPPGTVDVGGTCEDCGVFDCETCSAPGTCTVCADEFFLFGDGCIPCTECFGGSRVAIACEGSQDASCAECGPGTYSNQENALTCTPCAAGTFASSPRATECTPCAFGETSGPGQSACDCAPGFMGTSGSCTECAAGTFSTTLRSSTCTSCAAGTRSSAGSMSCTACPPGTSSVVGSATCRRCAPGTVAPSAGTAECVACSVGRVPDGAATACVAVCGDGIVIDDEACDDANRQGGDGCDEACSVEAGWVCEGARTECRRPSRGGCAAVIDPRPTPWLAMAIAIIGLVRRGRRRVFPSSAHRLT